MSTLGRKAWGDLARHRARTLLAVFTLAIATATLGFVAVPRLLNAAMTRQVQQSHLLDVGIYTRVIDLTPAQVHALGRLPGITAVSADLGYSTKATSAAGSQNISIAGGDLASAAVDTVPLLSGRLPGPGQVLADAANGRATDYAVPVGGIIKLRAGSGALVPLRVSGTGMNLAATPGANGSATPVFYASLATVELLRGVHGINFLGFRLRDDTTAGQNRAVAEVRSYLTGRFGSDPITSLPKLRAPGQWPGQSAFGRLMALLYIITILAFLSALFLIAATMNTLIAEQTGEIAILKTLGARRRQIRGIILRSAAMLGAAGAVVGTMAGILIAYLLAHYFAERIIDVPIGFGVAASVVVISLLLGPVLAILASLPALRRALRRPVAEALAGKDSGGYGSLWLDRLVARSGLLSRTGLPGSVRLGVRNALRQKRRSTAAIAQVAVAAGLAITFLAVGQSVSTLIRHTVSQYRFSVGIGMAGGSPPFGGRAQAIADHTPGVTGAKLVETGGVQYDGQNYMAYGLGLHPFYTYRLSAGHWFTAADLAPSGRLPLPPVVLGPALARTTGATVGRTLTFVTAAGSTRVRVIGIDTGQGNDGSNVYFPRPVLERLDGGPGTADSIWLTVPGGHAAIKRAAAAAVRRLDAAGYRASSAEIYVIEADAIATDRTVLTIVEILGLAVVAIMLMGLVSALSMAVLERTREIGILRCVGARARHIRRAFSAEAVLLAAIGWVVAIPLGWLMYQGLRALILHNSAISLPEEFPPFIPLATLVGVLVLTLLAIRGPLRRAVRIQPGAALRYQ